MVENIIKAGKHNWIWYMDFDILITNMSVSLTDIIYESLEGLSPPSQIDLLVTDYCSSNNY
ncbi:hypothetical protein N7540_002168 [Penicillium herquei]|nr:hypothetical protein N7540_002168 [Penicillium herquei]